MVPITKITGRLGNQMFQFAFLYEHSRLNKLDFYYQDPAHFSVYSQEVKRMFQEGIPQRKDKVGIHVRRAANPINPSEPKYSENSYYVNLLQTDYYQKAMALFPQEKFMVISDDIEFCKTLDIFKDCEFVSGTDVSDMNDFASCKAQIIANSSFSWWGAFISPYSEKVVAPNYDKWYSDGNRTRTVCPEQWTRI